MTPLEEHTSDGGPDFRRAPQQPYRPDAHDITQRGDMGILEVPVSVSFTRPMPLWMRQLYVHVPKWLRLRGMLSSDYLNVVDFAWLYPGRFELDTMRRAAGTLLDVGSPVLNVFIHSSELVAGASGRIRTEEDVEACFERVRGILEFCLTQFNAEPATLEEVDPGLRTWLGFDESAA